MVYERLEGPIQVHVYFYLELYFLYFSSTADTSRQWWRNTHRWAVQQSGCIMGIPVLSIDTFRFDFLLADVIVCAVDKQIWPFRQKNTSLFRSVGGGGGWHLKWGTTSMFPLHSKNYRTLDSTRTVYKNQREIANCYITDYVITKRIGLFYSLYLLRSIRSGILSNVHLSLFPTTMTCGRERKREKERERKKKERNDLNGRGWPS